MLIEYKIKFEKDGLTITQRVEPNGSGTQRVPPSAMGDVTVAKHLGQSFAATKGGDSGSDPGPGGGGPGSGPITILGPIIFGGSNGGSKPPGVPGGGSGPGRMPQRRGRRSGGGGELRRN